MEEGLWGGESGTDYTGAQVMSIISIMVIVLKFIQVAYFKCVQYVVHQLYLNQPGKNNNVQD